MCSFNIGDRVYSTLPRHKARGIGVIVEIGENVLGRYRYWVSWQGNQGSKHTAILVEGEVHLATEMAEAIYD